MTAWQQGLPFTATANFEYLVITVVATWGQLQHPLAVSKQQPALYASSFNWHKPQPCLLG